MANKSMPDNFGIRVAAYIRVSTEEQKLHGISVEAQTLSIKNWANQNNFKIVEFYNDAGFSARKPYNKRPAIVRLLEDVQEKKIDLIVFTKLDRWFRSLSDYFKVQDILDKNNVSWKTIQEDYDTTNASGRLKVNIMLSVAQDEADRTGERIKSVFESKIQRGEVISGKVPLGYKIENKKMVIDPETAETVRDIFHQYTVIRSVRSLREYIINKYGLVYGQTGVRFLLSNERYIGRAHDKDDFCPPLITQNQFQLVQDILNQRAQRNLARSDRVYLFTGLVRCAECGNRLSAHVVGKKYVYYRCTRYEKLHLCNHKKRTSELIIEKWLLDNLISCYEEYNMSLIEKSKIKRPKIDVEKIKRKMDKLKDLYINDLIERDSYEHDYRALKDELKSEIENEADKHIQKSVDTKFIKDVLQAYNFLTKQEQKEFWNSIIGEITITNDDVFFVSPFRHK